MNFPIVVVQLQQKLMTALVAIESKSILHSGSNFPICLYDDKIQTDFSDTVFRRALQCRLCTSVSSSALDWKLAILRWWKYLWRQDSVLHLALKNSLHIGWDFCVGFRACWNRDTHHILLVFASLNSCCIINGIAVILIMWEELWDAQIAQHLTVRSLTAAGMKHWGN